MLLSERGDVWSIVSKHQVARQVREAAFCLHINGVEIVHPMMFYGRMEQIEIIGYYHTLKKTLLVGVGSGVNEGPDCLVPRIETSHGYKSNYIIHFTGNNLSVIEDPDIHSHSIVRSIHH